MTETLRSPLPILGHRPDRVAALTGGLVAAVMVAAYVIIARALDTPPTTLEVLSVWASLACVWLARTENIWTMPYGLVAVVLLGWFFLDVELVAQGWLQFVFYVPVQIFGWWAWARGGPDRTEMVVTGLSFRAWFVTLVAAGTLWVFLWVLFTAVYEEPAYLLWDTSIVAASVTAQSLMTFKKKESWWWWTIPVNVSSIVLFVRTELWAFVFLYVFFLANSIWGWQQWHKEVIREH